MTDEELRRRLVETLRTKAAQVPEPTGAFDPLAEVAELNDRRPKPTRGAWRYALVSAALIALVVGAATAVLVSRSDDPGESGGPRTSITSAAPTVAPTSTTTAPTSTSTSTTVTPTPTTPPVVPPTWTKYPQQLPDGTVPVTQFNAYLDTYSSAAHDPKRLALTFTRLDPPPTEPPNAVRVEEHALANGTHQVVVFALRADDSVAEVRYEVSFAAHSDGTWRLSSASWSQRCQPNRGHQEFTTAFCI
jgi:hypothetical protein